MHAPLILRARVESDTLAHGGACGAEVMLELKEVRSLVTLAEPGSLTLTAERLHLSAAAIHKQ